MNPKAVGERSEAIILSHLINKGWAVSLPFGNNQRYDMLVDNRSTILRAQCKTGRNDKNGCIEFATSSKNGFTGIRTSYKDQVDMFLVYSEMTKKVYMVPIAGLGPNMVRLRVDKNKGGATGGIRWAKDYEI